MIEQTKNIDRRDREWEGRRHDILVVASDLFEEKGYAGTTMQDIADAAEFSVGYLYKQFAGKQDILDALAGRTLDYLQAIYLRMDEEADATPLQKIRMTQRMICRHVSETWSLTSILAQTEPNLDDKVRERFQHMLARDVDLIRQAQDLGELAAYDPEILAIAMKGLHWQLIKHFARTGAKEGYVRIPDIVDELLIKPLAAGRPESNLRKDRTSS